MFNKRAMGPVCALILSFLTSATLHGQEEKTTEQRLAEMQRRFDQRFSEMESKYQRKIVELTQEVTSLKTKVVEDSSTELEAELTRLIKQEHSSSPYFEHFHNDRNPTISLTSDFVLSLTDRDDSTREGNRFIVRELELSVQGHVDDYTTYHMFLFFDGEDVEVEEAYGAHLFDEAKTFGIRAGRFNTPFTPVSRIHSHDLPFVDFPGVVQEFLGGNFRGTGAELFHRIEMESGDVVRFNMGIVNSLDGDSHTVNGPLVGIDQHHEEEEEEEEFEAFGERSFDNFAFYAHADGQFAIGDATQLRLGTSVAFAPEIETTILNELGPVPFEDHGTLDKLTISLDVAVIIEGSDPGESLTLAVEAFFNRQSFIDEATALTSTESAFGFFTYGEYRFNPTWAIGASFDWFERAENSEQEWWDAGIWVTYNVSDSNRIHLEFRYFDDPSTQEYWGLMLQWVTTLGTHQHMHN